MQIVNVILRHSLSPVGKKLVIPSDTITLIPFESSPEAFYVTALLNSVPARAAIYSYSPSGRGLGTPAILQRLGLKKYDPDNSVHRRLEKAGEHLIRLHNRSKFQFSDLEEAERELEKLSGEYWSLSPSELTALREAAESQELSPRVVVKGRGDEDIHSRMFDIGTASED